LTGDAISYAVYVLLLLGRSSPSSSLPHSLEFSEVFRSALSGFLAADLAGSGRDEFVWDGFVAVGTKEGISIWLFHAVSMSRACRSVKREVKFSNTLTEHYRVTRMR